MYGVTVDQLLSLQKQRRVCIRLAARPVRYVGLDYLDPLLVKRPPSGSIGCMVRFAVLSTIGAHVTDDTRSYQVLDNNGL